MKMRLTAALLRVTEAISVPYNNTIIITKTGSAILVVH